MTTNPADDALFASLWAGDAVLEPIDGGTADLADLLEPSDELGRVARRVAGQYVEILARYAATAFAGTGPAAGLSQLEAAMGALVRLAEASHDAAQIDLLDALATILPGLAAPRESRVARNALAKLADWIPRFAATLEPEDGRRLLTVVHWEKGSAPLLDELASIKGMGRRRLARLYAAGLLTVDVIASARPDEIAQVTGLPRALVDEVVARARAFARDDRQRRLEELRDQSLRLAQLARSVHLSDDPAVRSLAAEAIAALAGALDILSVPREAP